MKNQQLLQKPPRISRLARGRFKKYGEVAHRGVSIARAHAIEVWYACCGIVAAVKTATSVEDFLYKLFLVAMPELVLFVSTYTYARLHGLINRKTTKIESQEDTDTQG